MRIGFKPVLLCAILVAVLAASALTLWSRASPASAQTQIPAITPTVAATSGVEGSLTATWSSVSAAALDRIEYAIRQGTHTSLPSGITWTEVTDTSNPMDGSGDETSQVIGGLNTGNAYTVWVRGVKAGFTAPAPTAVTATTSGLPTPTGIAVTPLTSALSIRWDGPASLGGATYVQYQCVVHGRQQSTTWSERRAGPITSVLVGGLSENTSYTCRVRYRTGSLYAQASDRLSSTAIVDATTLGYVPATLTATAGSAAGSIDLNWTMPANHQRLQNFGTFVYRWHKGTAAPADGNWDSGAGSAVIPSNAYDSNTRAGAFTITGLDAGDSYHIQLRANYTATISRLSAATAAAKGVNPPSSLSAAARTGYPGQATLTWVKNTALTTQASYQYRYEEGGSAPDNGMWDQDWTDVPSSDGNTTTHTVTGLKAGTQYQFQVRAVHSGNVGKSDPVSQTATTTAVPTVAAPTTSNVAGVSLTLNWTRPAALNSAFTAYQWQYRYRTKPADPATAWTASWTSVPDSSADADTDAHNESSVTVTGLTGLTEYEFQVRIDFTGDVGETAASSAVTVTTLIPSITPSVTATSGSDNSLTATWTIPAGLSVDGFEYAYRQGTHTSLPAGISWQDVPDSGSDGRSNETSQAITALDSGTTYTVWVRGEKSGATSADPTAATASTTGPWRPTGLGATASGTSIALNWDDRPSAGAAAHFEYKCEPTATPTSGGWTAIAASTSAATASSLSIGTAYTCSLRSRTGSAGSYAYSSPVTTVAAMTKAINAPTLTASAGTELRSIALSWTMPGSYDASLSGFQYRYEQGSAAPSNGMWDQDWTDVPDSAEAEDSDTDRHDERAYTITGLVGNTAYYIQLRAQYGTETSAVSSDTATAKAVAAPSVNPQSIDLSPTPQVHPGAIALSWYDANVVIGTRTIPGLQDPTPVPVYGPPTYRTGYEYRYEKGSAAPADGNWDQGWTNVPDMDDPADGRGDEDAITLTGLEFNTAYHIQIRSENSGDYGLSEAVSVDRTSGASPPTLPTPTSPTQTANSVTLQWADLSGVVREFTEYNWQYRYRVKPTAGNPAWTATWNDVADGADTGDSAHDENRVNVTGLSPATEYEFQVRIKSGAGASSASTSVTAKTDLPSITPSLADGANDNSLAVSWTIPAGLTADGFEYTYRQGTHGNDPGSTATWHDVPDSASDGRSNETSTTITGLDSGTTYTVWLRGEKTGFTAAGTVAATRTTSGPWRPTGFTVTRAARSLTLAWDTKPAGAAADHFQYKCATSNLASASWSTTADGTATSVAVTTLSVGTNYSCVIRSRTGAAAPYSYSSPDLTPKSATTLAFLAPEAPNASTGAAKGAVNLSWRVPAAASAQLSGFEYRYKAASDAAYPTTGTGSWASAGSQTATSLTVSGLNGNSAYQFQLRSVYGTAGYSDATATLPATSGAVAAPTSLTVAARTGYPGQVTLTWVKNTGVTTQNGFQYRYEEASSAPAQESGWDISWTDVPSSTGATLTYTLTGLKAGTTYYFQVRSKNTGNNGESNPASNSGTTTAAPTVSAPSTSSVTATTLTLSWTTPAALNSAFTAYQWQYRYKTTASGGDFTTATGGAPWTSVPDSGSDGAHNETSVSVASLDGTTEYQFQVRINFTGSVGESAASTATTVKTLIPSITPTVATGANDNSLAVNWTAPSGGTPDGFEYAYQQGTHSSLPAAISWSDVPDSGTDGRSNETTQTIASLNSGTTYTVWVRAEKSGFTTATPVAVTQTTSGPWRPTGFMATAGGTEIALDWNDRPSATAATDFEYKCEPTASPTNSGWTAIAASTSAATVSGLSVNTAYTCSVRSRTGSTSPYEYSSPVTTVAATTLAHLAPSLSASAGSAVGSLDLSWSMPSGYHASLSAFQYRWEEGSAAPSNGVWDSGAGWQTIALANFDSNTRMGSSTLTTGLVGNTSYYIQLRAQYGSDTSAESSDTATSGAVAAPTGPTAAARTGYPGQLAVSWSDVTNADRNGYEYRYDEGAAAPADNMWDQDWTAVPSSTGATTSFNLTGLKAGTQHYIQIRSTHGNNKGNSVPASVTGTSTAAPTVSAPSTASVTATTLTLSWTTPAALNAGFTAYAWQYRYKTTASGGDFTTATGGAPWTSVPDSGGDGAHNESSIALTGLAGTTEYQFQIRINFTGSVGESAASTSTTVKTLIPSITPTVMAGADDNSLAVSWSSPSGGTLDGLQYAHRAGTHTSLPAGITWTTVTDTDNPLNGNADETSQTISSLNSGTTYTVWVRGIKTGFTTSAPVPKSGSTSGPWRPTGLSATPGGNSIALDWDDRPSATVATDFEYKCEPTSSPTNAGWTAIAASTSAATASSLTANTAYTCSLRARTGNVGSYEYSSPVTTVAATTLAHLAPTLTASAGSAVGSLDLSWSMPSGYHASLSAFQYRWEKGSAAPGDGDWDSGAGWQTIALANFASNTRMGSLTLTTGLVGNTSYYIQLRAQYGTDVSTESSDTATSGTVVAPTGPAATARTGYPGQIAVSWSDVTNADRNGYEYRYEEGSAAPADNMWDQDWTAVPSSTGATTSFNLTGLKAGTQYYIQIRSTHGNNKGNSVPAPVTGTSTAAPTVAAPATSSVTATSLTLSWTTPAALNAAFTAYQWQYRYKKTASGGDFTTATGGAPWTSVPDSSSDADSDAHNETSVSVTSLDGTTEYQFQVRIDFTGAVGETAASTATTIKTLIPSITPTVAATTGSDNSLTVTWTAPSGGTPDGFEYAYQQGTHSSLPAGISWSNVPDSGTDGRSNETQQVIANLNSGTTFTVWVRAEKSGFTSADPAAVTQTTSGPWRPTGFSATAGGTEIALDWNDRPSATVAEHFEYKCEPTASPTSGGWTAIAATTSAATVSGLSVNTAYTCTVRSRTGSTTPYEYSSPDVTVAETTLAHLVPTLTATAGTDLRTIALTWTLAGGHDATLSGFQYRYEQGSAAPSNGMWDQDWTNVPDNPDATADPDTDRHDERAYTVTGLTGNTGYYIQLRAQYGTETSAVSSDSATAKAVAAPSVNPQSIDLSPTPQVHPGAVALSWYDANVVIGTRTIPGLQDPTPVPVYGPPTYRTGYEYRYEKGSAAPADGMWDQDWTNVPDMDDPADGRGDENSITLTGLEFNTAYHIQIRSENSGNYGNSEIASVNRTSGATPSTLPTLTAPAQAGTTVTLRWADLSGVVREFTEFNWQYRYRVKPTGNPAWTATWNDVADGSDTGDSAHDENGVVVTGLSPATEYELQIRIKSGAGASAASNTVTVETEIPSITPSLTDGANDNSLGVSWTIPTGLTADGFEYAYRQGTHGNDPGSQATWNDVPDSGTDGRSNETSVTISSLDSGTTYTVWLRAEKSGFTSASTVAATRTTTGPWRPTGFTLTRGSTSLTLSWDTKPAGASADHFQYKCATSNLASASWSTTTDGTATSAIVTGLNTGTNYSCIIRARTGASAPYSYSSPDLTPMSATTLAFLPPVAPSATTGTSAGTVNLSWSAPSAASAQLSGFEYQYKKTTDANYPTTGAGSWASAGAKTATSFTVTGLDGNRDYDFQLRSVFGTAGYSTATTKVSAKSGSVAAPASLAVAARTGYPGQATLTWTKNTGVSTQSSFQYRYEEGLTAPADANWDQNWTDVPGSNGNTTTYHVSGLKAGTFYYFQVRSKNTGNNNESDPASRSGHATPTPTVAAPTTSNVAATSLTLSWTRPAALNAAATAYQWQYRYKKTASGSDFTTATGGAPWTSVADSGSDGAHNETSVSVTGLDGTTEYQFQVRIDFTGDVGESAASAGATVKTLIPSITPTVAATSGNNRSLTVTWTAPSGGTPDGFEYAYRKGSHTSLPSGITWRDVPDSGSDGRSNETQQVIANLDSGTTYTVWIRGEKTGFTSAAPAAVTQTTSGPWRPTGFTATPTGNTIALDWADRPTGGAAAHFEYKCEPTASPTSGGWTAIAATTSMATVSSLTVNTPYTCSLRARTGSVGSYVYSEPVATVPAQTKAHLPPILTATAGTAVSTIALSWTMTTGFDATALSGFQYRYEQGSAAPSDGMWDRDWTDVPDSTEAGDPDTDRHDERAFTITGLTGNIEYFIELRAQYGTETSAADDATETAKAVAAPTVNPRPQDPTPTVHPGAITLAWGDTNIGGNPPSYRIGYEYRYEKGSAAPTDGMWDQDWTDVPDSDDPGTGRADETTITLTGLEFNTAYYIQMRSQNSGMHGKSEIISATRTTDPEPSTLPTASTTSPTSTSVQLNWTALTGVVTEFTEYNWQYRYRVKPTGTPAWTATWNDVADSNDDGNSAHDETGVTVTGLTATTEYEFQVRIKSGDGVSGVSNTVSAKTLIPSITPTVAATAGSDNSLTVTWTAPSGGTPDGFEYAYQQGTHSSLPAGISWNDVPDSGTDGRSNETQQIIANRNSGTTYTVWVRGEKTGFTSTTPVAVTQTTSGPWRPTGFSASPAGTSIALDWDDRPSAGVAAHFEYKCEPTASPTNGGWTAIAATTSAATVTGLTVNTAHTCTVRSRTGATSPYAYSSPDVTVAATTLAHLVPSLSASAGTAVGSINLSWTLASGYHSTLSAFQYRYEQGSAAPGDNNWDSGAGWQTIAISAFTPSTRSGTYTITGLTGNVEYYIELRAQYGTETSATDNATETAKAVAAPTSFTASARAAYPGQFALSWTDASNSNRTGYQYRYEEGSSAPAQESGWDQNWTAVPSSTDATRTFNLTGLKAGTAYYVQLRATHSGNQGNSEVASDTGTSTDVPTLTAPTTPTIGTTSATLSWTRPSTSVLHSGITTYKWQYRYKKTATGNDFTTATGGVPWTDVADSNDPGTSLHDETQIALTSLTAATEYQFQVRIAFNDANWGDTTPVSVTSKTQIPTPSISVSAGTDPGSVSISISAYATGVTVDKFQVRQVNSADACATTTVTGWTTRSDIAGNGSSAITHAISGLAANSRWKFEVQPVKTGFTSAGTACDSLMLSALPVPTSGNTPGFTIANVANTPGSVKLDWTGPTSTTIDNFAYRYKITQGGAYTTATGGVDWTDVPDGTDMGSLMRDERTYTLTGLKEDTGYTVQLRVEYTQLGESSPVSQTVTTVAVEPPSSVSATSNATSITVSWTASTSIGVTRVDSRHRKTGASWSAWTTNGPAVGTTSLTISSLDGASEYEVQVRAHVSDTVGNSDAASQTQKTLIPLIANLAEDSATQNPGSTTLEWDALGSNARVDKFQYRYERGTAAPTDGNWDQSWTDVSANGSAAVSHAVAGLAANSDYYFQVQTVKSGYTSTSANLTITSGAHITLAGVGASAGTAPGSVAVSWTKPSHSNIQEYRYRFKKASDAAYPTTGTGAWTTVSGGATPSSVTVTNLANNVSHNFEVLAYYGSVTGSSTAGSATATSKTLPAPSGFNATQGTLPGSIALTWDSMATTTEVDKFQYRFEGGSSAPADNVWDQDWTDVPSSTRATAQFQITGRTAGDTFFIQLRAVGTGIIGTSTAVQDTSTATTAPAPTGFVASTGSAVGEVDLAWNAGAGISFYQYRYKRTSDSNYPTSGAGAWTAVPDQDTPPDGRGDETAFTITGLVPGVEYHFQIRASVTNVGSSAATTAQAVTVKSVPAPTNFSASAGSAPGTISTRWSALQTSALRSGDSVVQYEYRYKLQTDTQYGAWTAVPDGSDSGNLVSDETSTIIANLSNGKQYDIQLRGAIDDNDADSNVDYYTDSASRTGITARIVAVPSGFRAATASSASGAIDLSWTAQTSVTAASAQYEYRYKLRSASSYGTWTAVTDSDSDGNTWDETETTVSNLTAETTYDFQLRFFVSSAVGASAEASASADASRVPTAMNFAANPGGAPGSITISWASVDGAAKYEYRCNPAGTGCTTTWQEVPDGSDADSSQANETGFTITGLTAGTSYSVELRAFVTGVGYSAAARASSLAQTQPGPATIAFNQGTNPGEITITWTAPTQGAVDRYEFQYRISGTQYTAWENAGTSPKTITGLFAGSRYDVRFRVVTPSGGFSLPNTGTLNTKPVPPPSGFTAEMGTNPGDVDLDWTLPTGATILRFEFRHRTGTGAWSTWTAIPDQDDPPNNDAGDETAYTVTGLSGGASYTFELRAVMQTIGHSASVSATVSATPISPPTMLTAATGTFPGDVDISWAAAPSGTGYQYRAKPQTEAWSDSHTWTSIPATPTSATIPGLAQGIVHDVQLRAVVTNVGYSPPVGTTATPQATVTGTAAVPTGFAISAARVPGTIIITLPSATQAVTYRTQPTNPGAWSPWITYRPSASQREYEIPDLKPGTEYNVEAHFYLGQQQAFTTALRATVRTAQLTAPANFTVQSVSGVMLLSWDAPSDDVSIQGYEYRTRQSGSSTWSDWVAIGHGGSGDARRQRHVPGLLAGVSHDFELRVRTESGPGPAASATASAMLRIPRVNRIQPVLPEVAIRTDTSVVLQVDIFGTQGRRSDGADELVISWYTTGGSLSQRTTTGNRVVYHAPSQQGYYTVTATAGPVGICRSHHVAVTGPDPCEAKFRIQVAAPPHLPGFSDVPENPPGVIPATVTGDDSHVYTTITPERGGTASAAGASVRAQPAAVRSGEYIAVRMTEGIPVGGIGMDDTDAAANAHDAYIGYRTHTLAGKLYSVTAVDSDGAPLSEYEFVLPAIVCVPLPSNLEHYTGRIVVVSVQQDNPDAGITVLGSRTFSSSASGTQVCASLRELPVTVAAAKRGNDDSLLPPAPTEAELPDAGATAPSGIALLLMLLTGLVILTGMYRMRRITRD